MKNLIVIILLLYLSVYVFGVGKNTNEHFVGLGGGDDVGDESGAKKTDWSEMALDNKFSVVDTNLAEVKKDFDKRVYKLEQQYKDLDTKVSILQNQSNSNKIMIDKIDSDIKKSIYDMNDEMSKDETDDGETSGEVEPFRGWFKNY